MSSSDVPGEVSSEAPPPTTAPERRLHPLSWLFVLLQQLRQFIVPLLVLFVFGRGDRNALWPLIGVAVLALGSLWQYFTYRYRITGDSLVVRSGLFERSLREIPFTRIHNVAVHQSVLHRLFKVAEVRLESAGGQKPEAQMRVLGLADALALEQLFRHRGPATAHETSDEASARVELLSLPVAEVIRLGLVSNRGMIVMAAAFGAAWQVFPDRMAANFFEDFARELFGYASHLQLGWVATVAAAVALLVLAMLALRALSVLLALVQYYGFRLSEDPRRLTVERGLLTKLRTSVARRRIQAWTLHEGVLHRLLRRRSLDIDTAVAERQGQNDARALKELAPIATPGACDALIAHLLPSHAHWPRTQWQPLPASAWWRLFLPTAALVVVLALVLCGYAGNGWGLLLLLWLPWSAYASRRHAARAGYSIDDAMIAVCGGWWSRYWRFAEIDKLQALSLRQSPLDRRFGMATLSLDTAGAGAMTPPLRVRYLPEVEARGLYERLGAEIARRPLDW